jgi:hypothetical protein
MQDPGHALRQYTQAISLFVWFDRGKDRTAEDIPWVNSITAESPPEPVAEQAGGPEGLASVGCTCSDHPRCTHARVDAMASYGSLDTRDRCMWPSL